MQSLELATMIAIVARPKTTSPDGEPITVVPPEARPVPRVHRVSPVRRTVGHWLIGLGGTLAGR